MKKKDNKKELSNFELLKQGYDKDLENLRKKIEQEVRAEEEERVKGRGTMNRYIANWKLQKYPYSESEKKKAVSDHELARQMQEEEIQKKIEEYLAPREAELAEKIFGPGGLEAAKAQDEREKRMEAFKARQRQRQQAEHDRRKALERKKEDRRKAREITKEQSGKITSEQDNTPEQKPKHKRQKSIDVKTEFNTEAERIRTLSMTFNEQNPEKEPSYDEREVSEKAARIEEFKARKREEFNRHSIERESGGHEIGD